MADRSSSPQAPGNRQLTCGALSYSAATASAPEQLGKNPLARGEWLHTSPGGVWYRRRTSNFPAQGAGHTMACDTVLGASTARQPVYEVASRPSRSTRSVTSHHRPTAHGAARRKPTRRIFDEGRKAYSGESLRVRRVRSSRGQTSPHDLHVRRAMCGAVRRDELSVTGLSSPTADVISDRDSSDVQTTARYSPRLWLRLLRGLVRSRALSAYRQHHVGLLILAKL